MANETPIQKQAIDINAHTNPSGRIVIRHQAFSELLRGVIAGGGTTLVSRGECVESFEVFFDYLGYRYHVKGSYTWDHEGFDTLLIRRF